MPKYMTENPSSKWCWETCSACFRCKNKGRFGQCGDCSGRHDPFLRTEVDEHDYCSCTEGVLRWRAKNGMLIVKRYTKNPFESKILTEAKTEDERDWEAYLKDLREKLDNPNYDPLLIEEDKRDNGFKHLGEAPEGWEHV